MSFEAYQAYQESGVDWLRRVPAHWKLKRLKFIASLLTDKSQRFARAVGLENIEGWTGRFLPTETEFAGEGVGFLPGDVLFGKLRPYLAKVWLSEFSGEAVGDFHVLRPSSYTDARYLVYLMLNREFISIVDGSTFGAKMPRVDWDFMANLTLPLPPLEEQKAITAFLDRETSKIDALVAEQRRLIELLQEKRQAVISHAVTKGLDPGVQMKASGIEWLGDVPEHWEVGPVKRAMEFVTSGSRGWAEFYSDEGEVFLRMGNLTRDSIDLDLSDVQRVNVPESAEGARTQVRPGDVIFSVTAYLGSVAVIPDEMEPAYVSQHVALVRLKKGLVLPRWIGYASLSNCGQTWFDRQAYGGTKIQLSLDDVANLPVPLPPVAEQKSICNYIDGKLAVYDSLKDEAERLISLLQERRTALISAAVTGKIDVREVALQETS